MFSHLRRVHWEKDTPETNKKSSTACGLERRCDSELWRTKGGETRGNRIMERTACFSMELIRGRAQPRPRPPPWPSGHLYAGPLWTAAIWLFPDCPHLMSDLCSLLNVSSGSRALPSACSWCWELGSSPSSWALGNSDRGFSMLGPWKLGMSDNPLVTRIGFQWLHGNCPCSERPTPLSLTAPIPLDSQGLDLGEGDGF